MNIYIVIAVGCYLLAGTCYTLGDIFIDYWHDRWYDLPLALGLIGSFLIGSISLLYGLYLLIPA